MTPDAETMEERLRRMAKERRGRPPMIQYAGRRVSMRWYMRRVLGVVPNRRHNLQSATGRVLLHAVFRNDTPETPMAAFLLPQWAGNWIQSLAYPPEHYTVAPVFTDTVEHSPRKGAP